MNKSQVETVEDVNEYYSKCRKIKFKEDLPIKNISDVMDHLLVERIATTYTRRGHHCGYGRARSIDDFYKVCKFYFPDKTIKDITKEFAKINENNCLSLGYCGTIRKTNTNGNRYGYGNNRFNSHSIQLGFKNLYSFNELMEVN